MKKRILKDYAPDIYTEVALWTDGEIIYWWECCDTFFVVIKTETSNLFLRLWRSNTKSEKVYLSQDEVVAR